MPPILHAKLGASNAHRWLYCAGSVAAENGLEDKGSVFAEEGTRAHDLAEQALRNGDQVLDNHDDQEMAEFVRVYTDYVRNLGPDLFIEQKLDYSEYVPGGFGTADAVSLYTDHGMLVLHIVDLKYGKGVRVDAENNPQGMLYSLGAYLDALLVESPDIIRISIVQPRLDHISEWDITPVDLLKWAEWVKERAEATLVSDAPRTPGRKTCQWCKAKATCPALMAFTQEILMADFEDLDANITSVDRLTDEQMSTALAAKGLIEGWLHAIEQHITDQLEGGHGFPGYKLVEGRSVRQWADQEKAEKYLSRLIGKRNAYTQKFLTPTQAEKVLGKDKTKLAKHIVKPAGKATLAPESDKRPAINTTAEDFEVLE